MVSLSLDIYHNFDSW